MALQKRTQSQNCRKVPPPTVCSEREKVCIISRRFYSRDPGPGYILVLLDQSNQCTLRYFSNGNRSVEMDEIRTLLNYAGTR